LGGPEGGLGWAVSTWNDSVVPGMAWEISDKRTGSLTEGGAIPGSIGSTCSAPELDGSSLGPRGMLVLLETTLS
jgi:hypothetical protein